MSTRWVSIALSTLVLSAALLFGASPAGAAPSPAGAGPDLTLVSQTQWVTPTAPWYTLNLAVGSGAGAAADLHVSVTMYSRTTDSSQLQQAMGTVPDKSTLAHLPSVPVTSGASGLTATTCLTVLPEVDSAAPTPAPGTVGACPAGSPTVVMGCQPGSGYCDDVYPVSVALLRSGSTTPVDRFTTFLTYEEPGVAAGHPLRVGLVMPVQNRVNGHSSAAVAARQITETEIALLAAHRGLATTLDVSPTTASDLVENGAKAGQQAVRQLATLTAPGASQLLTPSFVPINVAALAGAGLTSETQLQVVRGTQLLREADASLHPSTGSWVDTNINLSDTDAGDLATGLGAVGATHVVVSDDALSSVDNTSGLTFAQPFSLSLAHGAHVTAAAANSQVDASFVSHPADPVLAATQLLANLDFIHFENPSLSDPRGVVLVPPSGWHANPKFLATLLSGLTNSQIVSAVTLDELFDQVPVGGNQEPSSRHLQSGPGIGNGGFTAATTARITSARSQLASFGTATPGHPPVLTTLSDALLGTESANLTASGRAAALSAYDQGFDRVLSTISLAVERTITFTSRNAAIPITVLSSAPYQVKVVLSLSSDKFSFPAGATRTLVLNHATTSVRIQARARTSGDRLPVDVTLLTPDGRLAISRTVLTVHSTEISIVGVVLTVLAGLVLLVWWIRTWRKGRRRRPRAH